MASELLKNRALIQRLKEPEVPKVNFDLASTGFEELFTLPEPKPQELLDIQENVRIQRQQDTMNKARPFLMDESVDFIERQNFSEKGIVKKYGGSLVDIYTMLVDQWNNDVLKAYEAKDLSTLESSFADYAGKELKISNKKVNSQYSGLTRRNRLEEKILDISEFRKNLAKELITEANQGLKIVRLPEIASKLGPKYTNATLKTLIGRIPEIPELDTYEVKVNKAFQKLFVDVEPEKVLAKDFFNPAKKIQEVVGTGSIVKEDRTRDRTESIYKALKNNPDYKDLGFDKIFNRLRDSNFQKIVSKSDTPWTLSDVSYAVDNKLNLKNPKSIDERAINFAIRSKIQGNPDIEIFSREGDRLVKLDNPKSSQIDNYYDIVFRMKGKNYGLVGDIPGVINLQKEGRQLPEFKNFYTVAAAKDKLASQTKFPDGTDIINPRTGKPATFEELMKDTYYFGRGKKRGYAMAFPYDLEHLDIKNDPFGNVDPKNLRILPKRINLSIGDKTGKTQDVIKKTGYFFEKDLPLDQQIKNMMLREKKLSADVLKFDEQGNHIGRRLDTAGQAAKKQLETRGVKGPMMGMNFGNYIESISEDIRAGKKGKAFFKSLGGLGVGLTGYFGQEEYRKGEPVLDIGVSAITGIKPTESLLRKFVPEEKGGYTDKEKLARAQLQLLKATENYKPTSLDFGKIGTVAAKDPSYKGAPGLYLDYLRDKQDEIESIALPAEERFQEEIMQPLFQKKIEERSPIIGGIGNLIDYIKTQSFPGQIERMDFADGSDPKDPSKRKFMKLMGILSLLPYGIGKLVEPAAKVAPVVSEGVKLGFDNFMKLVEKIKLFGKDVSDKAAVQERQKVIRYQGKDGSEYELVEDITTGDITVQKDKPGVAVYGRGTDDVEGVDVIEDRSIFSYKKGDEMIDTKTGKGVKAPDEYDEMQAIAHDGMEFDDVDVIKDKAVKEVLDEID